MKAEKLHATKAYNSYTSSKKFCEDDPSIRIQWYGEHWSKLYLELGHNWLKFRENPEKSLSDFRSQGFLSCGLDDSSAKLYTEEALQMLINELTDEFVQSCLTDKNIGNCPFMLNYKDRLWDTQAYELIYYYANLHFTYFSKVKQSNPLTICEIGAGFGEMSRIIQKHNKCKYFIIDLPEANALSTYYLGCHYPDKNIYTFENYLQEECIISSESYQQNDIFILPPGCNYSEDIKFDFFLNMRSMMEMTYEQLNSHFRFIQQKSKPDAIFANFNRFAKCTAIYKYPYDNNWDVKISMQSSLNKTVHFLLAKRAKIENISKPIQEHLKQLEVYYKKNHAEIYKDMKLTVAADKLKANQ